MLLLLTNLLGLGFYQCQPGRYSLPRCQHRALRNGRVARLLSHARVSRLACSPARRCCEIQTLARCSQRPVARPCVHPFLCALACKSLAHAPGPVVDHGLVELGLCVHDEGSLATQHNTPKNVFVKGWRCFVFWVCGCFTPRTAPPPDTCSAARVKQRNNRGVPVDLPAIHQKRAGAHRPRWCHVGVPEVRY